MKNSYSIYKEWPCIPSICSGIQNVEAIPHSARRGATDAKEANERRKYSTSRRVVTKVCASCHVGSAWYIEQCKWRTEALSRPRSGFVEWLQLSCSVHAPEVTMYEVSRGQRNGDGRGVHIRVPTEEGATRQVDSGVSYTDEPLKYTWYKCRWKTGAKVLEVW